MFNFFLFFSNIEVAKSVAAAVRQVVCMEATINYLIANYDMFCDSIDKKTLRTSINNICDKLVKLKNTSKALHRRALHVMFFLNLLKFNLVCVFFSFLVGLFEQSSRFNTQRIVQKKIPNKDQNYWCATVTCNSCGLQNVFEQKVEMVNFFKFYFVYILISQNFYFIL